MKDHSGDGAEAGNGEGGKITLWNLAFAPLLVAKGVITDSGSSQRVCAPEYTSSFRVY